MIQTSASIYTYVNIAVLSPLCSAALNEFVKLNAQLKKRYGQDLTDQQVFPVQVSYLDKDMLLLVMFSWYLQLIAKLLNFA